MTHTIQNLAAEFRWSITAAAITAAAMVVSQTQFPLPANSLPRTQASETNTPELEPLQDNNGSALSMSATE